MTPEQNFQNFHNHLMSTFATDKPYLQAKDPDAAPVRWFVYGSFWTDAAVTADKSRSMKLDAFNRLLDTGALRPCAQQPDASGAWYEDAPASLADLLKLHEHTAAGIRALARLVQDATNKHRSCSGEAARLEELKARYAVQTETLATMQAAAC